MGPSPAHQRLRRPLPSIGFALAAVGLAVIFLTAAQLDFGHFGRALREALA